VGQLGESGEYWLGRLRVVCFYVQRFEGGSLRLCPLRTDRLVPVNKIELCTCTYGIYGDATNLVASTIVELDDTPLYFTDDIGIVFGPPTEDDTRVRRARLDFLLVIVKGSYSCCLRGSRVSCCQIISLAR
jgi:hypothetical protein